MSVGLHTRTWLSAALIACVFAASAWLNPSLAQRPSFDESTLFQQIDFQRQSIRHLEEEWSDLNPLAKGFAYVKWFIPFYSWINLCTATSGRSAFLLGNCLEVQRQSLFGLPLQTFRREYTATILHLWERSELDAIKFANSVGRMSSSDVTTNNALSIIQLFGVPIALFLIISNFRAANPNWRTDLHNKLRTISNKSPITLKSAFVATAAIWLGGGLITTLMIRSSGFSVALENLRSVIINGFGSLTIILGFVFAIRWVRAKAWWKRLNATDAGPELLSADQEKKWLALVKFDDEIRSAVERLKPFGDFWIKELARAYFSLEEDKRYLPSIVVRLLEEATEYDRQLKESVRQ